MSSQHCIVLLPDWINKKFTYIFFIHSPPDEVCHFCGQLESFMGAREIALNNISQKTLGLHTEAAEILSGKNARARVSMTQLPNKWHSQSSPIWVKMGWIGCAI